MLYDLIFKSICQYILINLGANPVILAYNLNIYSLEDDQTDF